MTTLSVLETLVDGIIQDTSFSRATIMGYLNQGVQEIAGGMLSTLGSWITPPLPLLFAIDTVDTVTDAAYVAMPTTFQRDLKFAASSDGIEIDIANSFIEFSQTYPSMSGSGSVEEVIEQGGNLYYQRIPTSAATITLHFHRFPVDMALPTSTPDGIPAHLHVSLLVNYAAWKIFELIEDGIDGAAVNAQRYEVRFREALRILELSIPYDTNPLILGPE